MTQTAEDAPTGGTDLADREWFNSTQAMEILQVSEPTLRRLYLGGHLKVSRPAGTRMVRFHRSWLAAYLKGHPMPADEDGAVPVRARRKSA